MHAHHPHCHQVHGGAAVLDIGGGVGALLALMDDEAVGTELFLRRERSEGTAHTGVWTRHQGSQHVTAALFCELRAGTYWVLRADGSDHLPVDVRGGELAHVDLRTIRSSARGR
ncbi:MAG TPA: hypothetical protein VK461_15455 [Acidimicrobiales bacterium]|nr:hypothetical protein [Acidimicrobiales bacterium]